MAAKKGVLGSDLAMLDATTDADIARQIAEDPDSAPELTNEELEQAEIYEGDQFIRRVGRPKGSGVKEAVTLRLDRDVLDHFRATGPGWQTRINGTLRAVISKAGAATVARGIAPAVGGTRERPALRRPRATGSRRIRTE